MMANFKGYKVKLEETHHTEKLDAPSGTAITLAEAIIQESQKYNSWKYPAYEAAENQIPIEAKRIEDVKGTHLVQYANEIDTIEIKHTAHTRDGFALGAVIAAEWLYNTTNPGIYSMKDVLQTFTAK
jgi:4-hydroxy-tetrahydrodipicolinate reductase